MLLKAKIRNSIANYPLFSFLKNKEICILVCFGVLMRLFLSILYCNITIFPDSAGYVELSNFLLDFSLSGYNGNRSPGYPFFIFLFFGSTKILIFFQFLLGILSSILWYKILLKTGYNDRISLYCSLFLQSFLHIYFYETAILTESVSLFFVSVLFWKLASGYLENKNPKEDVVIGFVLGFLVLIKPFYIFLPFLIYGLIVLKEFNLKRIINQKIIVLIFPLMAYFSWSYVNKINTGYFVSTTFFGLNLAQNCVHFAEKTKPEYQWIGDIYAKYRVKNIAENDTIKREIDKNDLAMTIWDARDELLLKKNQNFQDLSNDLGKYAIATIENNKFQYAKQVVCNSWTDFWTTAIYWNYTSFLVPFANKICLIIWYIQSFILQVFKILFLLLCPLHFVLFYKSKTISFEFIVVLTVFTTSVLQALVTYGNNNRFSYPFEFLMIIIVLSYFKKMVPQKYLK